MVIIFGASDLGKYVVKHFFEGHTDLVFYDNDRRKWGQKIEGIKVIDFRQFLNLVNEDDTEVVMGTQNKTAIYFLKDVCTSRNNILTLKDDALVKIDLNSIGKFERNIVEIETEKLKKCEEAKNAYAKSRNVNAYNHAVDYLKFKKSNLFTPEIIGVELTNYCNLNCPNCPTPTSKREKGYMSDETFDLALKLVSPCSMFPFSLHGLGEPLLHPNFLKYLRKISEIDRSIVISTNGILLEKNLVNEMVSIFKKISSVIFYVSFHCLKSVENWFKCIDVFKDINSVNFYGQVLEHNKLQAEKWLLEMGIECPNQNPYIRYISSHSFAGNVSGRKSEYHNIEIANRIRNCTYLKNNVVSVAWNGMLKSCCYDSEDVGTCGTIYDFEKARINPEGYKLCKNCDPDWTSNYQ